MTGGLTKDRFEEGCDGVLRLTLDPPTLTLRLEVDQKSVFREPTRFDVVEVRLYGQLVVGNPTQHHFFGNGASDPRFGPVHKLITNLVFSQVMLLGYGSVFEPSSHIPRRIAAAPFRTLKLVSQ